MRADVLILGQGLAGTLLGWALERAGIPFAIVDSGHARAATSAAAGIINPITGRRLVKSWRVESLLPLARAVYREMEVALEVPLWRDMRVRRWFADERERVTAGEKLRQGEFASLVEAVDDSGFWIREAARVGLNALLGAARRRWLAAGRLHAAAADIEQQRQRHELVIDCRGLAGADSSEFAFLPWEFSKGEILELNVEGLEPDVILNRRWWVAPSGSATALAGATHEPGQRDSVPSEGGRARIEAAVRALLGPVRPLAVVGHRAGVRVNVPDKRPVAGRHPKMSRLGLVNGLGAKGVLWAPLLARQWVEHLTQGAPFDPEVDVRRFGGG
jgi:glycine/D-amino acid oxidase-like deaminating enzyme